MCDSRRLVDTVLLCHHSTDELKVAKLKQSLQELGPITVNTKDEGSQTMLGGRFTEDLVVFCLSVEYVKTSEQFTKGKHLRNHYSNIIIATFFKINFSVILQGQFTSNPSFVARCEHTDGRRK